MTDEKLVRDASYLAATSKRSIVVDVARGFLANVRLRGALRVIRDGWDCEDQSGRSISENTPHPLHLCRRCIANEALALLASKDGND